MNVFGKPSAEPNLFELCRGEKTCPKGTFSASRAQSQAMLELCRGEKTCPKGTFSASRAQSQAMLELCRGEKTCPERTISLPRQKQPARHTLQARPTDPVQIIRNIVLPIYILDVPASLDRHAASDRCNSRLWSRIQVPTHPRTPASNRGFCRESVRNEFTALLVQQGI